MSALYIKTKGEQVSQFWYRVPECNLGAGWLAARHYSHNREEGDWKTPILPPGEKLILVTEWSDAVIGFVRQRFRRDSRRGVYCSIFRNEGEILSSDLIKDAIPIVRDRWGGQPVFTFVDPTAVKSQNPGACFRHAGWKREGQTARGLICFSLRNIQEQAQPQGIA